MPRAIVMLRSIPSAKNSTRKENDEVGLKQGRNKKDSARAFEEVLAQLALSETFVRDTGVILEFYIRTFGWPDYVISLYGPNEALLTYAVLELRRIFKESGVDAATSTYLGMCPEDPYIRAAEFKSEGLKKLFSDFEVQSRESALAALAKVVNLEAAKNYVEFHRIMLDFFDFRINTTEQAKSYRSGLQTNRSLLKQTLERMYFEKKNIRKEEKEKMLKRANL